MMSLNQRFVPKFSGRKPRGIPCEGYLKIGAGCQHCYAEMFAGIFRGMEADLAGKGHQHDEPNLNLSGAA
jgi:hypothetical protein